MNNPFEIIEARLSNIENLLLDLKQNDNKSQEAPDPDKPLTIRQAADLLGLAIPTLYSKVSRGEIPCWKSGKRLLFSREKLTEYMQQDRRQSGSMVKIGSRAYNLASDNKKR
ncbi:MAG: helix-turn-helix domain-containing protein [Bacteroidales bacterium]|jgi:excisionase family DNA binding protein|nr:helix-turn-helix domain-containing protein [Bacteroidales bacterium]